MAQMGTGKYTYELVRDFCKLPGGKPHRRTLVTAASSLSDLGGRWRIMW